MKDTTFLFPARLMRFSNNNIGKEEVVVRCFGGSEVGNGGPRLIRFGARPVGREKPNTTWRGVKTLTPFFIGM